VATVGERLKEERLLRGWSQRDLAREAGTTAETISSIETGQHEPRPSTLRKLAEGLDIEVRDLFMEPALPKAEAPRGAGRAGTKTLDEWLEEHGAKRILMSDEQVLENFERLASGSDRAAIPGRFEQEARDTFREEDKVLDALREEWVDGGNLLPKVEEGPNVVRRAFDHAKTYSQLGREIRSRYSRYLNALDNYGRALYLEGRADDFVMVNRRPQTVEAIRAALTALRKEAFENERGA
jgi:transcriptional regulator with XRE-family HTH domain